MRPKSGIVPCQGAPRGHPEEPGDHPGASWAPLGTLLATPENPSGNPWIPSDLPLDLSDQLISTVSDIRPHRHPLSDLTDIRPPSTSVIRYPSLP